jgi:hypothetical protein
MQGVTMMSVITLSATAPHSKLVNWSLLVLHFRVGYLLFKPGYIL